MYREQIKAEKPVRLFLAREDFSDLLDTLVMSGYTVIGPTVRDRAIIYDEIRQESDFPIGVVDEQNNGQYRLKSTDSPALFLQTSGPRSIKNFLYPSRTLLYSARGSSNDFVTESACSSPPRFAFIGVRPCDLHAMAIQDQVFLGGKYVDATYKSRREQIFVVAVNCARPGNTCFCGSMHTGPTVRQGFDLALTEVCTSVHHYFVVEIGSPQGSKVMDSVSHREADENEINAAQAICVNAEVRMGRTLETEGIKELFYRNANSPHWEQSAQRCLGCANCTMVCPTCFCSTVEDTTNLSGDHAARSRVWDSCFTMDFSYIHGGGIRKSAHARYRHWITHKLASWHDQFGSSGCVGCGRCITWCPVGIDITEEAAALRQLEVKSTSQYGGKSHD
jgi:sulfhydrogenase subunit beta (sulfur reductase)